MGAKHGRGLLVVEDDPGLQSQLKWSLDGFDVEVVSDREGALRHIRKQEPVVVTLDLGLPPDPANASEGLAALEEILALAPDTKVIVVTGNDDRENALEAVKLGAYDFYQKPIDPDVLGLIIERAYALHDLQQENRRLAAAPSRASARAPLKREPDALADGRVVLVTVGGARVEHDPAE